MAEKDPWDDEQQRRRLQEYIFRLEDIKEHAENLSSEHERLRRSQDLWAEHAPIGFVSIDAQGRIIDVNRKMLEIVGSPSPEATKSINALTFPPLVRAGIADLIKRCLEAGEVISSEFPYFSFWGKESFVRLVGLPTLDTEGKVSGCQCAVEDITQRKKAEDALRESQALYKTLFEEAKRAEDLYRSVLDSSADAIVVYDLQGRARYVNKSFTRLFGWTLHDIKDQLIPYLPASEKRASLNLIQRIVVLGDQVSGFETKRFTKDSRMLDVSISASRYHDHEGNPAGMLVILSDITKRKRAEQSLAKLNDCFLRFGTDPVSNISRLVALAGELLGSCCALYNRLEDGVLKSLGRWNVPEEWQDVHAPEGHMCYDVIRNEQDEVAVIRHLKDSTYAKTHPYISTYPLKTYVGKIVRCRNLPVGALSVLFDKDAVPPAEDEEIIGIVASAIGVEEERRSSERDLRESEQRYRSLFEHSPISLWEEDFSSLKRHVDELRNSGIQDLETYLTNQPKAGSFYASKIRVLDVNRATLHLFEAASKEHLFKGLESVVCEESFPALLQEALAVAKGDLEHEMETVNRTLKGDKRNVLLKWSVTPGHEETYSKVMVSIMDITERKRTEQRLADALANSAQLQAEAEKANKAKSAFLANMSHEFRTPLNAIIGFTEILEDETFGRLNERQMKYVGHVVHSGRHLLSLINDILDLAKVEAGRIELNLSPVNLGALLKNSLIMVKEKAFRHKLQMDLILDEELANAVIEADEVRLKQVMFNLLSNATKFTPDRGCITVEAKAEQAQIRVSVSDTGLGIKPEDQDLVFAPFEQVDSSYSAKRKGTGLGLTLCKKLVEIHEGRIWVESDGPGKGSTFTFIIPLIRSRYPQPHHLDHGMPGRTVEHDTELGPPDLLEDSLLDSLATSTRDGVTGLWNRKAILRVIAKELRLCKSQGTSLALLVLGIDRFQPY